MNRKNLKIIVSSFIVGVIVLMIGLFANQSSDIAFLGGGQNNVANVSGFLDQPQQGYFAQEETNSVTNPGANGGNVIGEETNSVTNPGANVIGEESSDYKSISGIDFESANVGGEESNFIGLLRTIFNWLIAIVIITTTLSIIVGAVQYMTTDAVSGKKSGKERMTSAIGGLILALMSWMILFTINEDIFTSNFLARFSDENKGETNPGANEGNAVEAEEEKTNEEIIAENNNRIQQLDAEADLQSATRQLSEQVKGTCFDADGNYIEPPINPDLCDRGYVRFAGLSGVETSIQNATERINEIDDEIDRLNEQNRELSNNENYDNSDDSDMDISDVTYEPPPEDLGNEDEDELIIIEPIIDDINDVENNSNLEDLIRNYFDQNNNGSDLNIDGERELEDFELNNIGYQNLLSENITVANYENVDITEVSNKVLNTLYNFRDNCCGRRETINGEVQYVYSFNVTDINTNNDSFIIDRGEMNKARISRGPDLWQESNNFIEENTYPDQNLVEITEYMRCMERSARYSSRCNRPDNYRVIEGEYDSVNQKGVLAQDLMEGREYIAEFLYQDSRVMYNNNSWEVEVK